jgi:hypothetical protein
MRRHLTLLAAVAVALLTTLNAPADAGGHGRGGHGMRGGMGAPPADSLHRADLDSIRHAHVDTLRGRHGVERIDWVTALGLSADQLTQIQAIEATYAQERQALATEEQAAVQAVLTPAQQAILAATTAGRHRRPALSLTADQKVQIETIRADFDARETALGTELQTAVEAVLTADQVTILQGIGGWGLGPDMDGLCPHIGPQDTGTTDTPGTASSTTSASTAKTTTNTTFSWGDLKSGYSE